MALSDPGFLLLFAGVFAAWHLAGRLGAGRWRWAILLVANAAFYALGATPTLWYSLAVTTLAAWGLGLAMEASKNKNGSKNGVTVFFIKSAYRISPLMD